MVTSAQVEIERLLGRQGAIRRSHHPELASAVDWLIRSGRLTTVLPGVQVRREQASDPRVRIWALRQVDPDAILTCRAAAFWSFWPDLKVTTVSAAVRSKRESPLGFAFSRRKIPSELVCFSDGVQLTRPALTALDLVGEVGGDAIDQALRVGATTLDDLRRALDLTPRRRGNVGRLHMLLDSRNAPWAKSERLLHRLLRNAGLTGWDTNVTVRLTEGRVALDVAFEAQRVAIEVDGWEYHGRRPGDFDATMRRHTALEAAGWRVLHVTWTHLVDEPEWVLAMIIQTLAQEIRPFNRPRPRAVRSA